MGPALGAIGTALANAEARTEQRNNAVSRARDYNSFRMEAQESLNTIQSAGNISDPQTVAEYARFLKTSKQAVLANHSGSADSRLQLEKRLTDEMGSFMMAASRASQQAGLAEINDALGGELNEISASVISQPAGLIGGFDRWSKALNDASPALNPEQSRALFRAGVSQMTESAVDSVLARPGGHVEARALLESTPGLARLMDANVLSRINRTIVKAEYQAEADANAGIRKVRELEQIKGGPLTAEERLRAAGLAPAQGRQPLSSKIAEAEQALNRTLTPAEVEKLAGIQAGEDRTFGAGITGRSLEIVTDDAAAFAAGLLSEQETRRFEAAISAYMIPQRNPDTGALTTPSLPPFARDALAQQGYSFDEGSGTLVRPDGTPVGGDRSAGATQQGEQGEQDRRAGPSQTVWDLAGITAGPVSAVGEALGRTPIVGEFVRAPEMTQARNFIPQLQRDLVRVLQNNPRYAEGERQAIESEININPATWDTASAMRNRLIGIDQALDVRERNAFETARSPNVGREERVQAMNVLNALVQFRQSLGVPVRVKSAEEAKKLPPGTQFIDPQGNVRVVP